MDFEQTLNDTLQQLAAQLTQRGWMMSTAESCTGGLIAAACTELPGSSEWFDRGFVTYSNAAKTEMLGVAPTLIAQHGAVSEEVVQAMAAGAITRSSARVAIAVSGIAGPAGGTPDKPVGTVWIAWSTPEHLWQTCWHMAGSRQQVRQQTLITALQQLLQSLRKDHTQ